MSTVASAPEGIVASEAQEALTAFLYRAPVGLVQTDLDGSVEMMNPMAAQLLMPVTPTGDLDNLFEALGPVAPDLRDRVACFSASHGSICEALRFAVDGFHPGRRRVYAISLMKIDAWRLMAMLVDVTPEVERESEALEQQLYAAQRVDALTRLPNRVAIAEFVQKALDRIDGSRGLAILSIGCERLRQIADSFGQRVKDQVLDLMAHRITNVLRPSDCVGCAGEVDQIAAHTGADEFIVLLQQLKHPSEAAAVAQRLLDNLALPYLVAGHELHCAVSIGIAPVDSVVHAMESILGDASLAMGEARRTGASRWVVFEPGMRQRAVARAGIENDLRQAISNDELFVVYQPVIGLRSNEDSAPLEGVEALVRWRHPTRGIVSPIEFIGIAEETGLIDALGLFVLRTACLQYVTWQRTLGERAPRLLAVNLSRAQLQANDVVSTIARIVVETRMPFDRLQLEVTESLAAQDDGIQSKLEALKALGVRLALDDFGTGYSSLSSLHLLPIDTLKIDRSFVMLLESSPHHRVLIEATIRVAHSLGMDTVAEGIENMEQAGIVRALGCEKAQGYLFEKPLTAELLGRWIEDR